MEPELGKGVLDPKQARGKFFPQRFLPPEELTDYVQHFWQVEWHLPEGETFVQHNIPHPAVHVVFERGRSEVVGPITGRFTRELIGDGRVVGAHIKPGMFSAFTHLAISDLTNRRPKISDAINLASGDANEKMILGLNAEDAVAYFTGFLLRTRRPRVPESCFVVRDLVAVVEAEADLTRSEQLAARAGMSVRSLQRLFRQHVGLSPKFVIQRFRLLEASARLLNEATTGAEIAVELGFADQAHFIRAFKQLVGDTPERYVKRNT